MEQSKVDKKFILNADDLGLSKAHNKAVLEGYSSGIMKSASLIANCEAFEDACEKVIPSCPDLGIGIHLNVTEGYSLCKGLDKLTDAQGKFNNSFVSLFLKSLNKKDVLFLEQLEKEFRVQIEKIMKRTHVTHIDSHAHIHLIPAIFELVCKLAKEYEIKQIRTCYEAPYIIPDVFGHLNINYPKNLVKMAFLNLLTVINEDKVEKYGLKTNDFVVGIIYKTMMTSLAVSYGLMAIKYDNVTAEAVIHPCRYEDGKIDEHFVEFQISKNQKLKNKIEALGYRITNYREDYECE